MAGAVAGQRCQAATLTSTIVPDARLGPVSRNLSLVAEIGLQALDDLHENRLVSADLRRRNIEFLESSGRPQAVLLLMVAPSVELLVQATERSSISFGICFSLEELFRGTLA